MWRNLLRTLPSGHGIFGTPNIGVPGSSVPSTGTFGPGYIYDSLDLPADNDAQVWGEITVLPTGLARFFAREDTSFDAEGPPGVYSFTFIPRIDGAGSTPTTASFTISEDDAVLCAPGNAIGAGVTASFVEGGGAEDVLNCSVGNAAAAGVACTFEQGSGGEDVLSCGVGNAVGAGVTCTLVEGSQDILACTPGGAVGAGVQATILSDFVLQCVVGDAVAAGVTCAFSTGGTVSGDDVVAALASIGLTAELVALLHDLAKIHGLVPGAPLTVTQTGRAAGDVNQTVAEGGGTVTVTRV